MLQFNLWALSAGAFLVLANMVMLTIMPVGADDVSIKVKELLDVPVPVGNVPGMLSVALAILLVLPLVRTLQCIQSESKAGPGKKPTGTKPLPDGVAEERKVPVVLDDQSGKPDSWLDQMFGGCLCYNRGEAKGAEPEIALRPADSVWIPGSTPWEGDSRIMHPKFCGLRLKEPNGLPNLERFPNQAKSVDVAWESLPCSEEELAACKELQSRVANIPGKKDPVTMLRFLRARNGRLEVAANMYKSAMAFREGGGLERGFRTFTLDDSLHRRIDNLWPPTALMGFDLDGDPVYWNRPCSSLDFFAEVPIEFHEEHEVYSITRILQALEEMTVREGKPRMYMTVVVDAAEIGFKCLNFKAAPKYQAIARIMEDNFPEMVKRIIIVRTARVFPTFWNVVSKLFDEGTRNKVQIADTQRTFEKLTNFIDPKWIPQALGGTNNRVWVYESPGCDRALKGEAVDEASATLLRDLHAYALEQQNKQKHD